ncbi:MAG TPA: FAD-dependent oxidoreductase, partial [Gemmataceae bacterium]|nr:FAD-dependent oxidoreductase [Gemmataceae bacterium]
MSSTDGQVVVVGGGVIGACCAYYLARAGRPVTVLERGRFGAGCSHGNCGLIVPSHVLPLAGPGAVRLALRSLFTPNSPFRIQPGLDLRLWSWLYHFSRRCNRQAMLEAGRAIQALLNSSRQLYDGLMHDEPFDCEWETRGLLFVLQTAGGMAHYAETNRIMHEEFGLAAARLDGDALVQREPALKKGLAGGFYYPADAHLRPDKLMASWHQVLLAHRITVRENRTVTGFVRKDGRVRVVATAEGDVPADAVVVAAGALTPLLEKALGCRVPIQPGKGYSITMQRPARCPAIP